jgi:dihydropteroate synthase
MQGDPKSMQDRPNYDSVVDEVVAYFLSRVSACEAAGVDQSKIILDPGIGFGKALEHNRSLLLSTDRFLSMGMPVLIGASRKSMLGRILSHDDPKDRLAGSLAIAYDQMCRGVSILRVHDVRETADMLKMYQFLQQG